MPTGTRPGRLLSLRIVNMAGEEMQLSICSDKHVWELHHEVRLLTKCGCAFDLVHNERGMIFGAEAEYGSRENNQSKKKKIGNLRVRTGAVITQVVLPPPIGDDGEQMPYLMSDCD